MKVVIEVHPDLPDHCLESIVSSMRIESASSPPGGEVMVGDPDTDPLLKMFSNDLSTARAMLNSYLGLLSVAARTSLGM